MTPVPLQLPRNPTREVRIGTAVIGGRHPIAVQSMTATHTQNVEATVGQINDLVAAGADIVRVAVDSRKDATALAEISRRTQANLSVDLQENYRLAEEVAPHVAKVRAAASIEARERAEPMPEQVKYEIDDAEPGPVH